MTVSRVAMSPEWNTWVRKFLDADADLDFLRDAMGLPTEAQLTLVLRYPSGPWPMAGALYIGSSDPEAVSTLREAADRAEAAMRFAPAAAEEGDGV